MTQTKAEPRVASSNELALDRTYWASERTMMAWLRTSLSMISFGFTIAKFFDYLAKQDRAFVGPMGNVWAPTTVGQVLVTIGIVALVVALLQHRQTLQRLHREGLAPRWSLSLTISSLLALLGVFALISLFLQ